MEKFFNLKGNNTSISTEVLAGLTTFFAMVYIIFVNPSMLEIAGMPWGGVFLATIFATAIGTLVMGLFANVPYALAPGMGLNALFTFTVVGTFGFTWQEALAIVFICGIINIVITVTKVRKSIIVSIPKSLQNAISGGIGLFIAYIGLNNVGFITFGSVPDLTTFNNLPAALTLIGIVMTIILLLMKVKGAILIGIIATTIIGIPMGVTNLEGINISFSAIGAPFNDLSTTVFAAFKGMGTLFSDISRLPLALLAIFAFSLSDTFDTIGTFVGTGRRSGIFTDEDLSTLQVSKGFKSKMEKALFADAIATSMGALLGTSNTTTYVESASGIEEGGRTGLTSVVVAVLFLLMILVSPLVGIVPAAATSPALVIVGIMMVSSFGEINWQDLEESIPAFFTVMVMTVAYNISYGIAFGFIAYVIVKLAKGKAKDIHPILWGATGLFAIYFILTAFNAANIL
ncbi:NCS2 family permease [Acholeplasma vituli]|uniref:NCS2 family permease n=1 Tax=Paracholeplasma vituli TaxID=69473 RepID=A0ABT2PTC0_9MOLU|nr:NCS2 family permease [Paracholeplasma vituli]MCU0104075.1 NCS2 family permease [Paracholeplasma vituli]